MPSGFTKTGWKRILELVVAPVVVGLIIALITHTLLEGSPRPTPTPTSSPTPSPSPTPPPSPSPTPPPPSAQYLDQMQPVEGQATTDPATANGHFYVHALTLSDYFGYSPAVEYNLGRNWKRLKGTMSVRDNADANTNAQFTIFLDGREAMTGNLRLGSETPVDLDVGGVLRLRFEIKDLSPPACAICGLGGGPFIWGDARVTR